MEASVAAGPQLGLSLVRALHAVALGGALAGPGSAGAAPGPALPEYHLQWARAACASAQGEPRGLDLAGVDADWCAALSWVGVPLARPGAADRDPRNLRWGRDLIATAQPPSSAPELVEGVLVLPPAERLLALTSLDLKPLRAFVAARLGIRLQAAAGIHVLLWANQAVLVSCAGVPLGGFFHGPQLGQRSSVALEPGAVQVLRW
jgi:hypothetical protein